MFTNKLLCRYIDYKFYKYLRIFTLDFTLSFEIYEKPYLVPGSGYSTLTKIHDQVSGAPNFLGHNMVGIATGLALEMRCRAHRRANPTSDL